MPDATHKFRDKAKTVQVDATEYQGTIKCIDESRGFAFIRCAEVFASHQCDTFVPPKDLGGLCVGDHVCFKKQVNSRGKPQAMDPRPCDPLMKTIMDALGTGHLEDDDALDTGCGAPDAAEDERGGMPCPYRGTVKFIDPEKGFGFISCEEFSSRDVYCPKSLLNGFGMGDHICFSASVNQRGQPQATGVRAQGAAAPSQDYWNDLMHDGAHEPAQSSGAGDLVHQGTVKKIDANKGYGFISCQELFDIYGSDVFAPHKQLRSVAVGDRVRFTVRVNRKSQPQAADVRPLGPSPEAVDADAGDEDGSAVMTGKIKSFDADRGYGFISSPEALAKYGRDVFLHSRQVKSFKPSDHVTFSVRINGQGHPQAYALKAAPKTVAWLASGEEEGIPADREEFTGEIKSFNTSHGYGFIGCAQLHEKFGRDVFIHQSQFDGLSVGDQVTFHVQVKRGQPQACDVTLAAPAPARHGQSQGSGETSGQRSELGRLSSPELDRKLLRACASARAESLASVEELLSVGADANVCDVTGQRPLMISALNARHSERKCRLLIKGRADPNALYNESLTVLQWTRERINPKFAAFLEALHRGDSVEDYTVALDAPRDND